MSVLAVHASMPASSITVVSSAASTAGSTPLSIATPTSTGALASTPASSGKTSRSPTPVMSTQAERRDRAAAVSERRLILSLGYLRSAVAALHCLDTSQE